MNICLIFVEIYNIKKYAMEIYMSLHFRSLEE